MSDPRVLLITGCSTGIGRDLAERATAAGWAVVATARRVEALDDVDARLRLPLDVTSGESVRDAVAATIERFGRIDGLVNNAGFAACGAVEEIRQDAWESVFDVNVFGTVRLIRAVAPFMRAQGSGRIVNMSSIGGIVSLPGNGAYSGAKFAVEALSDAARLELKPFGVHVIVIQPGSIRTRFDATMKACSAEVFDDPDSPYRALYRASEAMADGMRDTQVGPEVVSAVVLKALSEARPKARYLAGAPFGIRLLASVGDGLRDRVLEATLKKADRSG